VSLSNSVAIARNDVRIMRRDYFPVVLLVIMPLVGMVFMKPAFRATLVAEGVTHANGAEQAVPGMAVTFGFILVNYVCFGFFREHSWKTWERLRASPASSIEIIIGKTLASLLLATAQFVLLFGLGGTLMGLRVRGSWFEIVAVAVAFSVCLVAGGLAITAVCRTVIQASTVVYVGAVLFSCLAGALVPESTLPPWTRVIRAAIPSYWAMRGYRLAIIGQGGVVLSVLMLVAFAGVFAIVAVLRMSFDETKTGVA
jgi:ABC-2 type transport system permease protein